MPAQTDVLFTVGGDFTTFNKDAQIAFQRINSQLSRLQLNPRSFAPLGHINRDLNQFQDSLKAATARTLAFALSAGSLIAIERGIKNIALAAINVEKSLAEINIGLNLTSSNLQKFGQDVFKIASQTGTAFDTAAVAAREFSRQGLNLTETLKRTRDALTLTRLTGLEVKDAVSSVTGIIKSFNKELLDSTTIVNTLANVDQAFAISSEDIVLALQKVGNTAESVNVTFRELVALVTSVKERTGEPGPVIGNAFKTIFTRLQRGETQERLKAVGIDTSGSAIDTLRSISSLFESGKISPIQKAAIQELTAGVYQINRLQAAIKDLSSQYTTFDRALAIANAETDAATEKNERLNETLAAQLNALKNNIKQFGATLGQTAGGPTLKFGFGVLNQILGIVNERDAKDAGTKVGKGFLEGVGQIIAGPVLVGLGAVILRFLIQFTSDIKKAASSTLGLTAAFERQLEIQNKVAVVMRGYPDIQKRLLAGTISQAQAEREVLKILRDQAAVRQISTITSANIARNIQSNITKGPDALRSFVDAENATMFFAPTRKSDTKLALDSLDKLKFTFKNQQFSDPAAIAVHEQRLRDEIKKQINLIATGKLQATDFSKEVSKLFQNFNLTKASGPGITGVFREVTKVLSPAVTKRINEQLERIRQDMLEGGTNQKQLNAQLKRLVISVGVSNSQWKQINSINAANIANASTIAAYQKEIAENTKAEQRERRKQLRNRIATGVALGAPILASELSQFVPSDTKSGRVSQAALGGVATTATFGFLGSLIGPHGAAIGTGVGFLMGLIPVLENLSTDVPEITKNLEKLREKLSENNDQFSTLIKNVETLNSDIKLTPNQRADLRAQILETFTKIPFKDRGAVREAVAQNDIQTLISTMNKILSAPIREERFEAARLKLAQFFEGKETDASKTFQSIFGVPTETGDSISRLLIENPNIRRRTLKDIKRLRNELQEQISNRGDITGVNVTGTIGPESIQQFEQILSTLGFSNDQIGNLTNNLTFKKAKDLFTLIDTINDYINDLDKGLKDSEQSLKQGEDIQSKLTNLREKIIVFSESIANLINRSQLIFDAQIESIRHASDLQQIRGRTGIDVLRGVSPATDILSIPIERIAIQREERLQRQAIESDFGTRQAGIGADLAKNILTAIKEIDAQKIKNNTLATVEQLTEISRIQETLREVATKITSGELSKELAIPQIQQLLPEDNILIQAGEDIALTYKTLKTKVIDAIEIAQISASNLDQGIKNALEKALAEFNAANQTLQVKEFNRTIQRKLIGQEIFLENEIERLTGQSELEQTRGRGGIDISRAIAPPFDVGGANVERNILNRENQLARRRVINDINIERRKLLQPIANQLLGAGTSFDLDSLQKTSGVLSDNVVPEIANLQGSFENLSRDVLAGKLNENQIRSQITAILGSVKSPELKDITDTLQKELLASMDSFEQSNVILQDKLNNTNLILDEQLKTQLTLVKAQEETNKRIIERFREGKAFREDFIVARRAERENAILNGAGPKEALGGALQSFGDELTFSVQDLYKSLQDGAADLAASMKAGFKDAFKSFVDGTRSAEEALNDLGIAIFDKLLSKTLDMGFDALFSGVSAGVSSYFSAAKGSANGGLIQGYNVGGMVRGGSGVKDDVPAMLNAGEYVIKKSAVQKYGKNFLDRINRGKGYDIGGVVDVNLENRFDYNDPLRPTSGTRVISPYLSNFALSDANSVQNNLRIERENTLEAYLRDFAAYQKQIKDATDAFKDAQMSRLIGAYIGLAANVAGAGLGSAFGGSGGVKGGYDSVNTSAYAGYAAKGGLTTPYGFRHYNNGGSADNVPALLMGGEYVMSKSAVQRFGVDFMHKLNAGMVPKYQSGGLVGQGSGSSSAGPITPNINIEINVNVDKNGQASDAQPTKEENRESNKDNARQLGELIKSSVIQIINKESRDGGLLSQTFQKRGR